MLCSKNAQLWLLSDLTVDKSFYFLALVLMGTLEGTKSE